jgi:Rieske Fe-S protein
MNDELDRHPPCLTRRGALRVACAMSLGAAGCGGGQEVALPTGPIGGGNIKDMPPGTFKVMGAVAVARDANGLYAMSAICTHAGCATQVISGGTLLCPCHGSMFDQSGSVLRGPAGAALPHYQVTIAADGSITVLAGTIVPDEARVQVG